MPAGIFDGRDEEAALTDWTAIKAPDLAEFEAMAERAWAELPEEFRALANGLVIRIEDFPDEETLAEMECESAFEILGLFRGRGLTQGAALLESGEMPTMIWLYRRPILDYWAEHDETLGHIVTHVLVHEVGHHFGLSDEDMEMIEASEE